MCGWIRKAGSLTLRRFRRRREDSARANSPPPDWNALFAAAGLDISKFQQATPMWAPLAASDMRQAWTGEWPGYKQRPLHVEAAAWHGRPVYFSLTGPLESFGAHGIQRAAKARAISRREFCWSLSPFCYRFCRGVPGALELRSRQRRSSGRDAAGRSDFLPPHGAVGVPGPLFFSGKFHLSSVSRHQHSAALGWGRVGALPGASNPMFAVTGHRLSFPGRAPSADAGVIRWWDAMCFTAPFWAFCSVICTVSAIIWKAGLARLRRP